MLCCVCCVVLFCVVLCLVVVFCRLGLGSIFGRFGGVLGRFLVVSVGLGGSFGGSWGVSWGLGGVLGGSWAVLGC